MFDARWCSGRVDWESGRQILFTTEPSPAFTLRAQHFYRAEVAAGPNQKQ